MTTTTKAKPVADRWRVFAKEYLVDLNGAQAARRAGYSPRAAKQKANVLLKDPRVIELVSRGMAERAERTEINADLVLKGIQRIALMAESSQEWPAALKALELLGKHLKLFTDKVEHGAIGGGPITMHVTTTDENL